MTEDEDLQYMQRALALAKTAAEAGEVPVGAVIVRNGHIIGEAANSPIGCCDPTAHAEINALRIAADGEQNYRLPGATIYITIEPCAMCLGAMVHARIARIVFGAAEPKSGVLISNTGLIDDDCFNHRFEFVAGVAADQCSALISDFFKHRRQLKAAMKSLEANSRLS